MMKHTLQEIEQAFYKQAEVCGVTSRLYEDILKALGRNEEIVRFVQEIREEKDTGKIEEILATVAYFHYSVLKGTPGFETLKKFYRSYGGSYGGNFDELAATLNKLFSENRDDARKWLLTHRLQTNEINRCAVIYPTILSLGLEKINLVELGCSAGLLLLMDYYSYEYTGDCKTFRVDNHPPVLHCNTTSLDILASKVFTRRCEVTRRIGFDLNPVSLDDEENILMLKAALWDDPERFKRLEQAIATFKNRSREANLSLHSLDYTNDLSPAFEPLLDPGADVVIFTSASTYQVPRESYEKLLDNVASLAGHLGKKVYFVEFEGLGKKESSGKDLTEEEPFHLTVHTFPENEARQFARAHFHGRSITVL